MLPRPRDEDTLAVDELGEGVEVYPDKQLWRTPDADLKPVGFMDEDERLRGELIESITVLGSIEDIGNIVEERG